jgi:hypothetical protein
MKQTCVYWAPKAANRYGEPQYAAPVEVSCRWDDIQEVFVDATGNERVSRAKVMVDRDVALNGVLWLGLIAALTDEANPMKNTGFLKVMVFQKIPNRRATEFLRIAVG